MLLSYPLVLAHLHAQVRKHPQQARVWQEACERNGKPQPRASGHWLHLRREKKIPETTV
jgi:hypothetical protein